MKPNYRLKSQACKDRLFDSTNHKQNLRVNQLMELVFIAIVQDMIANIQQIVVL